MPNFPIHTIIRVVGNNPWNNVMTKVWLMPVLKLSRSISQAAKSCSAELVHARRTLGKPQTKQCQDAMRRTRAPLPDWVDGGDGNYRSGHVEYRSPPIPNGANAFGATESELPLLLDTCTTIWLLK